MPAAQLIVCVDANHELMSFISDWSNKEEGNNQQLLLTLSRDMSSSVEVIEYLSSSSSSRSGRQLKTGLGAFKT